MFNPKYVFYNLSKIITKINYLDVSYTYNPYTSDTLIIYGHNNEQIILKMREKLWCIKFGENYMAIQYIENVTFVMYVSQFGQQYGIIVKDNHVMSQDEAYILKYNDVIVEADTCPIENGLYKFDVNN